MHGLPTFRRTNSKHIGTGGAGSPRLICSDNGIRIYPPFTYFYILPGCCCFCFSYKTLINTEMRRKLHIELRVKSDTRFLGKSQPRRRVFFLKHFSCMCGGYSFATRPWIFFGGRRWKLKAFPHQTNKYLWIERNVSYVVQPGEFSPRRIRLHLTLEVHVVALLDVVRGQRWAQLQRD